MLRTRVTHFTALVLVLACAPACTLHLHVHAEPSELPTSSAAPANTIAGTVLDASGQPCKTHVSLVQKGGSYSMGTGNGRFSIESRGRSAFTLFATTTDGRYAIVPRVEPGTRGLEVVLKATGAHLDVSLDGRPSARLAVFHDGQRVVDRTVRAGDVTRILVPAGSTRCLLYGADLELERELELAPGEARAVEFALGG